MAGEGEQNTAMNMMITVLWDVMLCGLVFRYQHYAASHSLIIHPAVQSHTDGATCLAAVCCTAHVTLPALQLFAVLHM